MKKRGGGSQHVKAATNVRVVEYELNRARKIANKLKMKISDYFRIAIHEANEKYEHKSCGS